MTPEGAQLNRELEAYANDPLRQFVHYWHARLREELAKLKRENRKRRKK